MNTTALILCATVLALALYDVWCKYTVRDGTTTISWVLLTAAKSYPIIAFAMGVLMGHLFWQNCAVN